MPGGGGVLCPRMHLGIQPVPEVMAMLRAMLLEDVECRLGDLVVGRLLVCVLLMLMLVVGHADTMRWPNDRSTG